METKKKKKPPYNGFYVEKYYPPKKGALSRVMQDFLNHWIYRAENQRYYRHKDMAKRGLCEALVIYLKDYEFSEDQYFDIDDYVKELRAMFVEDGLDAAFPFTDGITGYLAETDCFGNTLRKEWVKKRIHRQNILNQTPRPSRGD